MDYKSLLMIIGAGTKVKLAYNHQSGFFFYQGTIKDAPPVKGDLEIVSMYIYEGEDALTIVLEEA